VALATRWGFNGGVIFFVGGYFVQNSSPNSSPHLRNLNTKRVSDQPSSPGEGKNPSPQVKKLSTKWVSDQPSSLNEGKNPSPQVKNLITKSESDQLSSSWERKTLDSEVRNWGDTGKANANEPIHK
jgi:hypothetical protein